MKHKNRRSSQEGDKSRISFLQKIWSVLTLGEWYDSSPIVMVYPILIFSLILGLLLFGIGIGLKSLFGIVGSWETTLQVSLVTIIGTFALQIATKFLEEIKSKRLMRYSRRVKAYEIATEYLYEFQNREGFVDVCRGSSEEMKAFRAANRAISMWASEKVQLKWAQYIEARNSESVDWCAYEVMGAINYELGCRYRSSYFAGLEILTFWHGCTGYKIVAGYDKDQNLKSAVNDSKTRSM